MTEAADRGALETGGATRRSWLRAALPSLVGLVVAVAVVLLLRVTGSLRASDDALVVMGFDPERARLITALIAGAAAGVSVAALGGLTAVAVLASLGATGAEFWSVFHSETTSALQATGAQGAFDPVGWLLSVATLAVAGVIVGWAAATLTAPARRFILRALSDAADTVRGRRRGASGFGRAAAVLGVVVVLAATLPVFADMVNYAPDVHMRTGGTLTGGLTGLSGGLGGVTPGASGAPGASASAGPAASPGASSGPGASPNANGLPSGLVAGPLAGSLITPGVLSAARPWAAKPPSGTGQVTRITLPAPWTGGLQTTANVDLYLPPGYGTAGVRYPVLYETPYGIESWAKGVAIASMLDNLITSGAIPPMIVAFASTYGGPYQDVECADTFDGREKFDTYVATQLVPYMDAHYTTIASPTGRALIGASQGGYCAAALWSHHPDVFGASVSFSGYFQSGVLSPETQNAARPFGNNGAYEAKQSPINVVASIPAALAKRSFVVLSADFGNAFFGPQLRSYAAALSAAHVPMALVPAPLGHSWQTQRDQLPTVLAMLGAWMTQQGAFGKV
ncbi:MAG TPA: alpha/beta hydrolase-fold protein [Candidatus Limnocylindrales bacterium]